MKLSKDKLREIIENELGKIEELEPVKTGVEKQLARAGETAAAGAAHTVVGGKSPNQQVEIVFQQISDFVDKITAKSANPQKVKDFIYDRLIQKARAKLSQAKELGKTDQTPVTKV
tara:strand:+ start:250 stop:597 length:348 start_codon:yes stop_codon:yes gene_type:complete